MKALVDNDAVAFITCSALEDVYYVLKEADQERERFELVSQAKKALGEVDDPENHSLEVVQEASDFQEYVKAYKEVLDKTLSTVKADSYKLYSEKPGSTTYRHEVAFTTPYKERANGPLDCRPVHLNRLKQWCVDNMGAFEVSDIETDDALCIVQTAHLVSGEKTIICQNDKDILQCQGNHFRLHANHRDIVEVRGYGEIELSKCKKKINGTGSKFFFTQVLTGDKTDTYGGLPRVGPANAYKLLKDTTNYREGLQVVIDAYHRQYGDEYEKYLLEQGRLAWMLRDSFSGNKKDIPLWDLSYEPRFG